MYTIKYTNKEIWDSLEVVESTDDEKKIIKAYQDNDDDYEVLISHDELKKELGLD